MDKFPSFIMNSTNGSSYIFKLNQSLIWVPSRALTRFFAKNDCIVLVFGKERSNLKCFLIYTLKYKVIDLAFTNSFSSRTLSFTVCSQNFPRCASDQSAFATWWYSKQTTLLTTKASFHKVDDNFFFTYFWSVANIKK